MLKHQRIILQTLLVLYLLPSYNEAQGKIQLSELKELELEKQLQLLNKPSIKTIKSKHGDVYSCVDFYKQPAFDHLLLKNHNFHPENSSSNSATKQSSRIWSANGGCPSGTVPIRVITKDDLVRHINMPPPEDHIYDTDLTTINNNSESKRFISSGYKLAVVNIRKNSNSKFAGAGMAASLWNPHVEGQQHSACRLKIQNGPDIIQVGWRVDPILYKDTNTRLFVHFQAGNTHCFNTLCPGFVQVNTEIPVDMVFDKISHRGGSQSWECPMYIERDPGNGNWWVLLDDEPQVQVGFWPQKIFTSLASYAHNIEWGGVAYSPSGMPEPPMGSSYFPVGSTAYDAYCRRLTLSNYNGEKETIYGENTTIRVDDPNLYRIRDVPRMVPSHERFVLYGGPGDSKQVQV